MISIIIPTLNEESVIGDTVARLNTGLKLPHEVIITDGKSTDRTREGARAAGARIVEYTGTTRQTIAMGRNDGAAAATGEYLAFMDADCQFVDPEDTFSKALAYFDAHPDAVAQTMAIRVLPQFETWADKTVYICFNAYLQLLNNVFGMGISAGEFQMIRASAFKKVGGYNPALVASEDVDIFFRLGKIGKIRFRHDLTIYQTGRRGHKVGWPRLLTSWIVNSLSMMFRKKAYSKEWTVIR